MVTLDEGSQQELQDLATQKLNDIFLDSKIQELIGEWEVVWGPCVFKYDGPISILEGEVTDSVMYMAKSKDINESECYVIAIAGTNLRSLHGWIVQDFWVNKTKLWNNGQPWKADPEDQTTPGIRVSAATSTAMRILCEDMQSDQKSLLDSLKEIANSASKPISINTCGQSLGGTLSPALALSLMDRRSEWDPEGKATFSASPTSGATPGNDKFATYYDSQLGNVTDRIWNSFDFVPHGWAQETLEETRTFYEPYIPTTALIDLFVDFCLFLSKSSGVEYKHVRLEQDSYPSEFNPDAVPKISAGDISKLVVKLILHSLGIENAPKDLIDAEIDIIKPLIEELIEKNKSGKSPLPAGQIKQMVEPYVQQIIEKLQTEKLISNIKGSINHVRLLLSSIWDFIKYIFQTLYQHAEALFEYMQISEYITRLDELGVQLLP
ncbi:hypothetical protein D4Z78_31850 [Okeania hirsuta]|uniref:Fungal lipase-type domain-containing protein n=2 Tax=Okeania hirsuta TaxID=1458930 RepID=A0A3Q8LYN1_9CYAN|nr:hypothetical protein [Okeania hirsuta]RQH04076.2 hypothetical protein D4Z78_31850 [Okeania hirsuta]